MGSRVARYSNRARVLVPEFVSLEQEFSMADGDQASLDPQIYEEGEVRERAQHEVRHIPVKVVPAAARPPDLLASHYIRFGSGDMGAVGFQFFI